MVQNWKLFSAILVCCCVSIGYFYWSLRSEGIRHLNTPLRQDLGASPSHQNEARSRKLILVWTTFFGQTNWIPDVHFGGCPDCRATEDKSRIAESDALIMHERDLHDRSSLPRKRSSHQRWIWLSQETHMNFETNLTQFAGMFNWTMTYRLDSDVVLPYGTVLKRSNPLPQLELEAELAGFRRYRKKLVAIRISNCNSTNSGRMTFVRKLEKLISVDVLGACGVPCSRMNNCDDIFMRQYKFYLAFENSNCKDYITEKLWMPLNWWNSIPVVMGGSSPADYEAVAPPHSYIHVDQFKSIESLAEYLKLLDKNQTLYDEYLLWRKSYRYNWSPYCDLCEALQNKSLPVKWYRDLADWYTRDACSQEHRIYN